MSEKETSREEAFWNNVPVLTVAGSGTDNSELYRICEEAGLNFITSRVSLGDGDGFGFFGPVTPIPELRIGDAYYTGLDEIKEFLGSYKGQGKTD